MLYEESQTQLQSMNTNQTIVKLNEQLKEMAVKNRQLEDVVCYTMIICSVI